MKQASWKLTDATVSALALVMVFLTPFAGSPFASQARSAEPPVFSGPQEGEPLPGFLATAVRGESADEPFDFVQQAKGQATLLFFFGEQKSRPAFAMARALTRFYDSRKSKVPLHAAIVFLTDDPSETMSWARKIQHYFPESVALGVSRDGKEGPGAYGLDRHLKLTVLVAKEGKVTGNFALNQPSMPVDAPRILASVAKVLGEDPPTLDSFLKQNRSEMTRRGGRRMMRRPESERGASKAKLDGLLRRLIRKQATADTVADAAKAIEAHIAENEEAAIDLARRAKKIVAAGKVDNYGTPAAQERIRGWAEKLKIPEPAQRESNSTQKEPESAGESSDGGNAP